LLKILEDTPKHVYFMLCTTDPNKLLPTIRNRCAQFVVSSLNDEDIIFLLRRTTRAESVSVSRKILDKIVGVSNGSARSALVCLEKVIGIEDEDIALESLSQSEEFEAQIIDLCRALIGKSNWPKISSILDGIKEEPENVRRAVLGYCQAILKKKLDPNAYYVMTAFADNYYDTGKAGLLMSCYEARERE